MFHQKRGEVAKGWGGAHWLGACVYLLVTALLLVGCGDGDNPPAKSSAAAATPVKTDYSVKGYLLKDGKRYPVKFGPAAARAPKRGVTPPGAAPSTDKLAPPSQRLQNVNTCPAGGGGCSPLDVASVDTAQSEFDGESLLMAVADSCMREQRQTFKYGNGIINLWPNLPAAIETAAADPSPTNIANLPRVWEGDGVSPAWFVFSTADFTGQHAASLGCDQILARQEALLCTASRLSDIADGVGNTEIETSSGASWVFPVQDLKDKFILRDLALATLGHIALLETQMPTQPPPGASAFFDNPVPLESCSDVYVKALNISTLNSSTQNLFTYASWNTTGWLPLPHLASPGEPARTLAKAKELIAMRGDYKANVYRAAGRLLRDLLDKSIQADIAGAEGRRADAGDPALGLQLMWGANAADDASKYNSMRHAFRLLFGRLDWMNPSPPFDQGVVCTSPSSPDAKVSVDGLIETVGAGFSARWDDRPPQTASQSLALSILTQSGVLLPAIATPDEAQVRSAVTEQLQIVGARARGITLSAFNSGDGATAIANTVAQLPIEDLRFALDRNVDAYRQLTNLGENIVDFPSTAPNGLAYEASEDQSATVKTLGGTVLKGGIPRQELHVDMTGLTGPTRVSAQCATTLATEPPLRTANLEFLGALQGPFPLAHLLQTRLRHLASAFDSAPSTDAIATVVKDAGAAATELRTWAAPAWSWPRPPRPAMKHPPSRVFSCSCWGSNHPILVRKTSRAWRRA
jgi:hypothetical protein